MPTHYETLGVPFNAIQLEVRDAYWALARIHHPDAGGDTATFTSITNAYAVLSDGKARRKYDKFLRTTMNECKKCNGFGVTYGVKTNLPKKCKTCNGVGYVERS